ncbi:DNA-directed RNA polymerase subunit omega [Dysosmobacter acutus]|nr:DNA-directed RNA polymerase subunit omega [Dysosmobacter acutus]
MNKLNAYIPNRYMLVNVVARRARQLAAAAEQTGEHLKEKPVTMALHEVAEGKMDANKIDTQINED